MAMFDVVAEGFRSVRNRFEGKRKITEENIDNALKDIRMSMLEADVNFKITKEFIQRVKEKALGEVVKVKAKGDEEVEVSPGDHFVKICHDELENLLGPVDTDITFADPDDGPTKIMLVGLQGSGKTTSSAKLAKYLIDREEKNPLMVGADVYRPGAIDQLRQLGDQLDVPVEAEEDADPVELCNEATETARQTDRDTVIYDTAGRLAVDDVLMNELEQIANDIEPENIFLVIDAMIGQDAVNTAQEFNKRLEVDGFILTKLDGDARGGAALSIKEVTGKPIKFIGVGEKLDDLEKFRPEGLANRILGYGDVMGLMDRFERSLSEEEAEKAEKNAKRMLSGEFDFNDFYDQLAQISKMGSMGELMEMMPFGADMPDDAQVSDEELGQIRAIIQSMTEKEKSDPDLLTKQPSRIRRISMGSGTKQKKVRQVIDQFNTMRRMMDQFGSMGGGAGGLLDKIPGMDKLNQLRQMKNMDLGSLFGGDMGDMGDMSEMLGEDGEMPEGFPDPTGGDDGKDKSKSKSISKKRRKRRRKKSKKGRKSKKRRKRRRRKKNDD
jgi:signal recognition particle subunit SRP54